MEQRESLAGWLHESDVYEVLAAASRRRHEFHYSITGSDCALACPSTLALPTTVGPGDGDVATVHEYAAPLVPGWPQLAS